MERRGGGSIEEGEREGGREGWREMIDTDREWKIARLELCEIFLP